MNKNNKKHKLIVNNRKNQLSNQNRIQYQRKIIVKKKLKKRKTMFKQSIILYKIHNKRQI